MNWRRGDVVNAAPTTCAWLLGHTKYCEWLAEGHGLLWIKGNPGTGKSTVLKHALESAEREAEQNCILASFFFHGRGAPIQKDVLGLFRSLLHQILQQNHDLLSIFTSLYRKRCSTEGRFGSDWNWNKNELQTFFRSHVVDTARKHQMRIYIDALDESGQDIALELVEFFRVFAAPVSICFTCRHYPFVSLEGGNEICVEDENEQDIKIYVQDKIKAHIQRTDIAEAIRNEIVSRSQRNFQWAVLVIPRVLTLYKSRKSMVTIRTMIQNTPAELNELYTDLLDCIDEHERVQSLHFMQWICFALQPLTLRELRLALAVDPDTSDTSIHKCLNSELYVETDEDMKPKTYDLSKGLAEVLERYGRPIVQFIHQSVQDFLLEKGFQKFDSSIAGTVIGQGHLWILRSCIKYLSMVDDSASSVGIAIESEYYEMEKEGSSVLERYSQKNWRRHFREVGNANMSEDDLATLGAKAMRGRFRATSIVWQLSPTTILHTAVAFNFISMVNAILNQGVWADQTDGRGQTPLSIAATRGYLVLTEILLNRDNVDANLKNNHGDTPLALAAIRGHEAVVEMLMSRDGVDINTVNKYGDTPLALAAAKGHKTVVEMLMSRDGVDMDSENIEGNTPLALAAARGHEAVVEMLVSRDGVDVDSENMDGDTPLSLAAAGGHEAVVEVLLKRVGNLGSEDSQPRTALHRAAKNGHYELVKLLLQHNADAWAEDGQNQTPLSYAASNEHYEVVKLLLRRGAMR